MADRLMKAQVTIPLDSGIPEDVFVNTFYFDADSDLVAVPGSLELDGVESLLTAFYQHLDGRVLAPSVGPNAHVKVYDMRDPTPRVEIHEFDIALTPMASGDDMALPSEVALCGSFAAQPVSGVNPQRLRGRVYLGPIHVDAAFQDGAQCRPTADARHAINEAMETMSEGFNTGAPADTAVKWAIYSPRTDLGSSIDDAFNDVVSGWVDDSFDTQRRRGPKATLRSVFP